MKNGYNQKFERILNYGKSVALSTGPNLIKLFTSVIHDSSYCAVKNNVIKHVFIKSSKQSIKLFKISGKILLKILLIIRKFVFETFQYLINLLLYDESESVDSKRQLIKSQFIYGYIIDTNIINIEIKNKLQIITMSQLISSCVLLN